MFSPLDPALHETCTNFPRLRGVVFDMDGTLCKPQTWMFAQMRKALGIDKSVDILEHIESLPLDQQAVAEEAIRAVEREAMLGMIAQPGLRPLMEYLASRGIPKSICTRNFDAPTQHLVSKFLSGVEIAPIITRKYKPNKPHPAAIRHIAQEWGISTSGMLMVGDSMDDMLAGNRAGARTVLLLGKGGHNSHLVKEDCTDASITRLDDLIQLLESGTLGGPEPLTERGTAQVQSVDFPPPT